MEQHQQNQKTEEGRLVTHGPYKDWRVATPFRFEQIEHEKDQEQVLAVCAALLNNVTISNIPEKFIGRALPGKR